MCVYLITLGTGVWHYIETPYVSPVKVTVAKPATETSPAVPESHAPKPLNEYDNTYKASANADSKGLNALFLAIRDNEAHRISSCATSHAAWEALRIAYEGDEHVREQQLQAIQTEFEDLRFAEYEKFDEFYLRSSSIVNRVASISYVFHL